MDWTDDSVTVAEGTLDRGAAAPKMKVRHSYIPPLDGSADLLNRFDTSIALDVFKILAKHYFGYDWHTFADSRQGIIYFSIPSLMGPTLRYVIRLGAFEDLNEKLVMRCGGELLERMNLPRSAVDVPEYYAALQRRHTFDFGASLKRNGG